MPTEEKRGKGLGRRKEKNSVPTLIMQGFEKMGTRGRLKLFVVGVLMLTAGGSVGLFADALSFYRFIIVVLFVIGGIGCVFPQWGILMVEFAAKLVKPGISFLSRPDRRNNDA